MILNLRNFLKEDTIYKQFILRETKETLEIDDSIQLVDDIVCVVDVYKTDQNIYSDIGLTYTYLEDCARCLEQFNHSVTTNFSVTISDDDEIETELIARLVDDKVDLNEIIIQSIFLSKPLKVLCKQDCEGICPTCGSNKNYETCNCSKNIVDPRLEELKKLLNKEV